ncbi:MAG: sensor histidine kinase [Nitrospirae bacterium]|nr:MAG: sensor histidine kinase [Nitrospirota bacterium]
MSGLSLKWKYIGLTFLILFCVIGGFSYYNLRYQERIIREDDIERVQLISDIIKNGLYTIMLEGRGKEFQNFLETLIAEDIEEVRIFHPETGVILASSVRKEIGKPIYKDDMEKFRNQDFPQVFVHSKGEETLYSMVIPIPNERPCQRCHNDGKPIRGVLDVEVSMKKTHDRIAEFRKRTALFSVLSFLSLAAALGIMTTLLINRPIERLILTMKEVEAGDLSVRFRVKRKDEIGKLAESFNSMLGELKKAQDELQRCHLEEMKRIEKMATLGELASAIAHEIKNPLAGISGAIQVLAEDFEQGDPRKETIEEVLREIERLDKTIRDLLNFSRPVDPKIIEVDLKSIIEKSLSLVKNQAQKQNIDITFRYDDNISMMNLDPQQIQQVFLNIILNAFHAMPDGGQLLIEAKNRGDHVEVAISDTGVGIRQEDLKRIFKPFFTTRHTGTGLGLPISSNIIEAHGGEIKVDSTPGLGSTFRIILPIKEKKEVA